MLHLAPLDQDPGAKDHSWACWSIVVKSCFCSSCKGWETRSCGKFFLSHLSCSVSMDCSRARARGN